MTVLDQLEAAVTEALRNGVGNLGSTNLTWDEQEARTRLNRLLRNHAAELIAVVRAAEQCVLLEYDPARNQEINDELGRRAAALRTALAPLLTESEPG